MYSTMTVKYSKKDWVVEDSLCCNSAIKSITFFFFQALFFCIRIISFLATVSYDKREFCFRKCGQNHKEHCTRLINIRPDWHVITWDGELFFPLKACSLLGYWGASFSEKHLSRKTIGFKPFLLVHLVYIIVCMNEKFDQLGNFGLFVKVPLKWITEGLSI